MNEIYSRKYLLPGLGILMLGIVGLIYFYFDAQTKWENYEDGLYIETQAEITYYNRTRNSDGDYHYSINYEYIVDNVTYSGHTTQNLSNVRVGTIITIYYNSENPNDVEFNLNFNNYLYYTIPIIALGIGYMVYPFVRDYFSYR